MTAIVGPLPTITFRDGARQAYSPPRDTCDNRYAACTDHHPACDCREALFAEDRQEHRAAMDDARMVIAHLIDAPCPPSARQDCRVCMAALTTWLHRYESAYRERVPF
jgi:hypothetical protein